MTEAHALALLHDAETWEWPSIAQRQEQPALPPKLIACAIVQSNNPYGAFLDKFWVEIGQSHPRLKAQIAVLRHAPDAVPVEKTTDMLMDEISETQLDLESVHNMAEGIFRLGVAFLHRGETKSASCTPEDIPRMDTGALLEVIAANENSGAREHAALERLIIKRDGQHCPLTGVPFNTVDDPNPNNFGPALTHIIPTSLRGKSDTLALIATLAGPHAVEQHLTSPDNAMLLQSDAHCSFIDLCCGIEARAAPDGTITYIYRRVYAPPYTAQEHLHKPGPGTILLRDGDTVPFRRDGPLPALCNLHLAVARIMRRSGAARVIEGLMREATGEEGEGSLGSMLSAKLLLVT